MKRSGFTCIVSVFALSAASGVLLALALPPRNVSLLGWAAFLPLLAASRLAGRSLIAAMGGLVCAFVCGWMLARDLNAPAQWGNVVVAFGCLALVLAFVAGWSSFTARRLTTGGWALSVAFAGVVAEFASQILFPVTVAISQHQNPAALRAASLTGVWGVSFALWLVPAALIALVAKPRSFSPAIVAALAVVGAVAHTYLPRADSSRTVTLAAIQAQDPSSAARETRKATAGVDAVVWPEFLSEPRCRIPYQTASENGTYLVASYTEPAVGRRRYNAAYLISPAGRKIGAFRKRHPFGRESMVFSRGEVASPVRCDGFTVGVTICYDTEFTDVTRELVRKGAEVILVPNSDPDTPGNLFSQMHSAVIPFRAAENGAPIAWAECDSESLVADGHGNVVARAEPGRISSAVGKVRLREGRTLYSRWGDYFAWLSLCTLPAVFALSRPRPHK